MSRNKQERYVSEGVGISKENGVVTIQIEDTFIEINSFDWELLKPLITSITMSFLSHHMRHGYIHSNEIDNIIFKK